MAPKSLKVWLADYIWEEISHVITWKHDISQGIKADPDGRFGDDGSNFRCLSLPPDDSDVQLIQVLSNKDTVTGFVSDGATRVKAQFSDEAVATFEEATDESLDVDVTGDVFQMKKVTIISTPFGPADGFVQLYIEELQYKHHLRKPVGAPAPIEDDENIRLLIDNIKRIRVPPIKEEPEPEGDIETTATTLNGTKAYPKPSRNSPVYIEDDNSLNYGLETQVPRTQVQATKRKAKGPSLSRDGFEIKQGVNLAQPTTANFLLNLMDKGKSSVKPTPSSVAHPKPLQPSSSSRPAIAASKFEADVRMSNASPEPEPAPSTSNQPGTSVVVETPVKVRAALSDNLKYGRRKIPENQKKLLENASSWYPTRPGRTPVHPNVPVELLTRWNSEAATAAAAESRQKSQTTKVEPSQKSASPKEESETSSDSDGEPDGSEEDSEEELIPEEDWPASQSIYSPTQQTPVKLPTRKPPPPSSATDQLEIAAPQTLPREPKAMRSPANMKRHLQQHPSERDRFETPSQHHRLNRHNFMEEDRRRERESKQSGFGSPPLHFASEYANTHRPEMNAELKQFYDQWLQLGEGEGNAFSSGNPRSRTRVNVDVLSWKI